MDPMKTSVDLGAIADRFRGPIESPREYDAAVACLNQLLDAGAMDEASPLAPVVHTLGILVSEYESRFMQETTPDGVQMLQFLMEQHGMTVSELPELGSAREAAEIMKGRKQMTPAQLSALASRFKVSPAAFA